MDDPIILVTGASGLLGQALMRQVQDDYDVLGFDVVEAPDDSPAEVRHLDVTSDMSTDDALERVLRWIGRAGGCLRLLRY